MLAQKLELEKLKAIVKEIHSSVTTLADDRSKTGYHSYFGAFAICQNPDLHQNLLNDRWPLSSSSSNVETGKMSAVAMSKPVSEAATIG